MKGIKYAVAIATVALLSGNIRLGIAGPKPPDQINFTVKGTVVALAQKGNTCWATAATILVSWQKQRSLSIEDVVTTAGPLYRDKFIHGQYLSGPEQADFLKNLHLQSEAPQNYTVKGWVDLLQKYGPLLVTTQEDPTRPSFVHVRVVKGIFGDGSPGATFLKVIDPVCGVEYNELITIFIGKFEDFARWELGYSGDLMPQVIHLPSASDNEAPPVLPPSNISAVPR